MDAQRALSDELREDARIQATYEDTEPEIRDDPRWKAADALDAYRDLLKSIHHKGYDHQPDVNPHPNCTDCDAYREWFS